MRRTRISRASEADEAATGITAELGKIFEYVIFVCSGADRFYFIIRIEIVFTAWVTFMIGLLDQMSFYDENQNILQFQYPVIHAMEFSTMSSW